MGALRSTFFLCSWPGLGREEIASRSTSVPVPTHSLSLYMYIACLQGGFHFFVHFASIVCREYKKSRYMHNAASAAHLLLCFLCPSDYNSVRLSSSFNRGPSYFGSLMRRRRERMAYREGERGRQEVQGAIDGNTA